MKTKVIVLGCLMAVIILFTGYEGYQTPFVLNLLMPLLRALFGLFLAHNLSEFLQVLADLCK